MPTTYTTDIDPTDMVDLDRERPIAAYDYTDTIPTIEGTTEAHKPFCRCIPCLDVADAARWDTESRGDQPMIAAARCWWRSRQLARCIRRHRRRALVSFAARRNPEPDVASGKSA